MIYRLPACFLNALFALLIVFSVSRHCNAEPGYGKPLTTTIGTIYNVAAVNALDAAIDATNSAGIPATILVADGVYVLDRSLLHVQCDGLIIRSVSGNRDAVVIRGPDEGPSASATHVFLIPASNVTIADMTFGYCRYHGIQVQGESPQDASGLRVHNCRIINCNEQFIKGSSSEGDPVGARDGIIENCLFEFTGGWGYQYYTGGIDIHRGVNWIVRDNLFRNIRNPGSGIAEHAIHFWDRCPTMAQNVVIERNIIINCDRGIGFGLGSLDGGHNGGASIIRNNFVYNDGTGNNTDVGIGLEYADHVAIDNNTVYNETYWAPIEYRFSGSTNLTFRNNLTNRVIRQRDGAPAPVLSHNLENADAAWFADLASGDLHVKAGAAEVIDKGMAINSFADDIDGNFRPSPAGGGWDIGADEYAPNRSCCSVEWLSAD